mgnify:FL=1
MRHNYQPKPLFLERMNELLGEKKYEKYKKAIEKPVLKSLRVNTLKISVPELEKKLEAKGWKINQPFKEYSEILIIEGKFADENKRYIGEKDFDFNKNSSWGGRAISRVKFLEPNASKVVSGAGKDEKNKKENLIDL